MIFCGGLMAFQLQYICYDILKIFLVYLGITKEIAILHTFYANNFQNKRLP